ncbi:MAG: ArnT family glycosyltransferase [Planctomycetota bacterium]
MLEEARTHGSAGRQPPPPRARPLDFLGLALAALLAWPALLYPFGRDQAIVDYVARALLEGHLPYTAGSAVVVRTPGIFCVFALADAVFGLHPWSVRIVELLTVLGLGWIVFRFCWSRAERRDGHLGASVLLVTAFYYVCFDYWHSAQQEIWETACLMAALALALTRNPSRARDLVCGLLCGAAFLFKYPAALPGLGIACAVAFSRGDGHPRKLRERAASLGWFALGGSLAISAWLVPYVVTGKWKTFWEVGVEYVLYYTRVSHPAPAAIGRWPLRSASFLVLLGLLVTLGLWKSGSPRLRDRRLSWTLAIGGLAVASIFLQRLFFGYHWGVVTPFVAALVLSCLKRVTARGRTVFLLVAAAAALGLALGPKWLANPGITYAGYSAKAWKYAFGAIDRSEFLKPIVGPYGFNYAAQENIGRILSDRASPGDTLCVAAKFEPVFYVASGLKCPSRFPIQQGFGFRDGAWLREHAQAMQIGPPTFVVGSRDEPELARSLQRGYRVEWEGPRFVVLRRTEAPSAPQSPR